MNEYRIGLILSAGVHVVVAVVASIGLPALTRDVPSPPDVIAVDFVRIDDVTRVVEPEPEPEPPQPEPEPTQAAAPPPAAPEPAVAPPDAVPLPADKPEPVKPEPVKKVDPKPRPERAVARSVTPRSKPRPPSRLDLAQLESALLDKANKKPATPTPVEPDREKTLEDAVRRTQQTSLQTRIATATLQAAIQSKVQECWSIPKGAKDLEKLQVRVRILLRQDGRLLRPPEFIGVSDLNSPDRAFFRTFAESARRAVQRCEPYDNLPVAQYDQWKEIEFTFDASQMLGG